MQLDDEVVQLVPLGPGHVDFMTALRTDWANYDYYFDFGPNSREQQAEWISRVRQDSSQMNFVITLLEQPQEPIGTISLVNIHHRSRNAEYGRCWMSPAHRGTGATKRASRILLNYGFNDLNLRRIYLFVFADNEPALRMYHSLGFQDEGLLRKHVYKDGQYRDVTLTAILKEDFT